MRLAHSSVLQKNPEAGEIPTDECGLHFCPIEEAAAAFRARTAGKTLFVSDERSYARLAFAATFPRAVSVVLESADALPLFSMPDGVGAVFVAGGEETLLSARFYAEVVGLPCAVAPSDGALYGALSRTGRVRSDGECVGMPLKEADVFCDLAFMRPTLSGALARIALARLARFEARALAVFSREKPLVGQAEPAEITPKQIVRANAALRRSENEGAYEGEGAALARMYRKPDARRALRELSALYAAFFKYGKPRKYTVADYAARAKRAGIAYGSLDLPTPEQYARRALMLERRRADLLRELELVLRKNSAENDSVYTFSDPAPDVMGVSDELLRLPEHRPDGLCAVIRDFGLLERS